MTLAKGLTWRPASAGGAPRVGRWLLLACLLAFLLAAAALAFWRWPLQHSPLPGVALLASDPQASLPDSSRPRDEQALLAGLEQHLQRQPGDPRALIFKARIDLQADRFDQAAAAYERALQGRSKAALDAGIWVEYAEAVAQQQGGRLAGQPRGLLERALLLNGQHPQALDLAGSAAWEAGEFSQAAAYWQRLLPQLQAGSSRHQALTTAIDRAGQRARLALPREP